jgi:multicomponent Na+:H+ antiporter subunit E
MRRLAVFIVSFVIWCLLAWPYDAAAGRWDLQIIVAGLVAAAVVALVFGHALARRPALFLNPVRWFWTLVYIPVFAFYCLKANLQVAYLVLHPAMPIRPGIVRVRTKLRSQTAIAALANSITLTPGTLTVDAEPDGTLYVHWIDVKTAEETEATEEIVARFEGMLGRIFE